MPLDTISTSMITGNTVNVTANSGSLVSANAINFSNTSSVKVSVAQGATGIANISFTSTVSLGMLIALSGD
jgi:cation transport ATPase